MARIDQNTTIGALVTERPSRSRIFEALHIDYCCGGKLPLAEACARRGLDPADVVRQLEQEDAKANGGSENPEQIESATDPASMGLAELASEIERTHHAYLREELPRLDRMTAKVHEVHGHSDARLGRLREAFEELRDEVLAHIEKEEKVLFPMVRELEAATEQPRFHCGSIANPIRQMESEHDNSGDALAVMREVTDGYRPPEWACNTYRAMLDGLERLERDMHEHIHKENNVLFPEAIEREASLGGKKGGS